MKYIVITSINEKTAAVYQYASFPDWHLLVVGDLKSKKYDLKNTTFLDIDDQKKLNFKSVSTTPYNHYSRKNIGYLYAMMNECEMIYDTDDDTIPYENWGLRDFTCETLAGGETNINPYSFFTDKNVWPRGYDLSEIKKRREYFQSKQKVNVGVWQGVIDGDSDFDAIYRLTVDEHIKFKISQDIAFDKMCFAPFNTQSTLWNKNLNSLLYIPISVDFRFTDILRGYISQRIMWDYGYHLGFHSANTYQIRNPHNYFSDFLGEINMYKNVPKVVELLKSIKLSNFSIEKDLFDVYKLLHQKNIVTSIELDNLENWIKDVNILLKK